MSCRHLRVGAWKAFNFRVALGGDVRCFGANGRPGLERCPPKAEARGSNPFGCAKNIIQINDLETHVVAMAVREILAEASRKQFARSCGEDRRVIVGQYGRHFSRSRAGVRKERVRQRRTFGFASTSFAMRLR
jgi:hypothetical protein